jgi:hypothetical protein
LCIGHGCLTVREGNPRLADRTVPRGRTIRRRTVVVIVRFHARVLLVTVLLTCVLVPWPGRSSRFGISHTFFFGHYIIITKTNPVSIMNNVVQLIEFRPLQQILRLRIWDEWDAIPRITGHGTGQRWE